jgi:ABC-type nitrate/sulfonate/bicarbonate transport system ATPase subunit
MLLLDEGFSALDWDMRTGCFDALKDLCNTRGMSVLLVSHDDRDAAYLGCKIMRLSAAVP